MRIGLVQTEGIGDVVIALPIAKAFVDEGHTVCWPVNETFVPFLRTAAPYVEFIPVPKIDPEDYFMRLPLQELRAHGCDVIHVLYSSIFRERSRLQQTELADYLKFDEYKYAVTGVPFARKWQLEIVRDMARERELFEALGVGDAYICMHASGSDFAPRIEIPASWLERYQVVCVDQRSNSPFDWLLAFERASKIVCVDSCFSNLVDQLNMPNEKYLVLRSPGAYTPVLKNGWRPLAAVNGVARIDADGARAGYGRRYMFG